MKAKHYSEMQITKEGITEDVFLSLSDKEEKQVLYHLSKFESDEIITIRIIYDNTSIVFEMIECKMWLILVCYLLGEKGLEIKK